MKQNRSRRAWRVRPCCGARPVVVSSISKREVNIHILFISKMIVAVILTSLLTLATNAQTESSPRPSPVGGAISKTPLPPDETSSPESGEPTSPPMVRTSGEYLSSSEFIITLMVVILSLIALGMEFVLLRRITRLKAEDALRVFAVTLVIIGTLLFVIA